MDNKNASVKFVQKVTSVSRILADCLTGKPQSILHSIAPRLAPGWVEETPRLPVERNGESKLPVIFVIDTSSSLNDFKAEMQSSLEYAIRAIQEDPVASGRVELCVIAFDDAPRVLSHFQSIKRSEIPQLDFGGCTHTHEAIDKAIDLLQARKEDYKQNRAHHYQPWLFILTDAQSNDTDNGAFQRLLDMQERKKLTFFGIGLGHLNTEELQSMLAPGHGLVLNGDLSAIKEAFAYISQTVLDVAHTQCGEEIKLSSLPSQITLVAH